MLSGKKMRKLMDVQQKDQTKWLQSVAVLTLLATLLWAFGAGANEETNDSSHDVERCLVPDASSPDDLVSPTGCGRGGWIPRPLLLQLFSNARRGEDCPEDIKSSVLAERAVCERDKRLLSVVSRTYKEEALLLREKAYPPWMELLWKGIIATAVGAAVGAATGAGSTAISDNSMSYGESAAFGATTGAIGGILVVSIYEWIR